LSQSSATLKPKIGDVVTFISTGSTDPDGAISSYYFDFGDGTNSGWISTTSISYKYVTAGIFTCKFRVKDDLGACI
jgi:microbial collagenase